MRLLILALLFGFASQAAKPTDVPGNPKAPVGGTYYTNLKNEPESLNPINSTDVYSSIVDGYVMEGLLTMNPNTYELEPGIAEKWEESKDGLTYTFTIREGLTFSDGKPLTIEDVKFSFETVKDPAFKAAHRLPYYEEIQSIEIVDPKTIRFKMKKPYFKNIQVLGSGGFSPIVPKHVYGDPKKMGSKTLVGSGAYMVDQYNRGKNIILKKNPKWWGNKDPRFAGANKFEKIYFRFIKEENLELEMVKKGQLDFMETGPEVFVQKAVGGPFGKTVLKHQVENQDPTTKKYSYVGWNLKNPLFQDQKVRKALVHLMNRQLMNEKFRFNLDDLATGPTYYRNDAIADKSVKPMEFDPKKAGQLLKEAGWEDKDKNGILEKTIDGKKVEFKFTLLFANRDVEKYFTMYKEDLKKAGIHMDIRVTEWNAFLKLLDEKKFEAVSLAWGVGSLEQDLKQIWHSSSSQAGGSNYISYANPKVDKLIDQAREELNQTKRLKLWKEAYRLIGEDAPYAFMFSTRYDLYVVNKRIGMVAPTLKYSRGADYWWVQE